MDNIILSRLNLISDIDEDTPLVVLEEISRCHDIPLIMTRSNAVFKRDVENRPIGIIHNPVRDDEWNIVARYVNPDVYWPLNTLQVAYSFLVEWETGQQSRPPRMFSFGPQIPTDPTRFNACLLYKICRRNGISLNRDHTIYQMATVCHMLINDVNYARTILYNNISHVQHEGLLQLYLAACQVSDYQPADNMDITRESNNYNALEQSIDTFTDRKTLLMRIRPQSYSDAIVLAALNFNIDLSAAIDPVNEYSRLYNDPVNYIPNDKTLCDLIACNAYILRLDEYFNPHLPPELYNNEVLERMVHIEGFTNADLRNDSAYTLLQTAYMSATFYHGRQPGIKNNRTPFLYEEVQDLHNDLIICFGVQGVNGTLNAFRYNELDKLFRTRRNFGNPLAENEDPFPELAITKLKNLCKIIRAGDSQEIIEERENLYEAILTTEIFTDINKIKIKEMYEIYEHSDSNVRSKIGTAIDMLFHLSMYMRGWSGDGEYPIENAPVDNQAIVDLNVTIAINTFELACTELDDIGNIIMNLPLFKFRNGEFLPMSNANSGRTIAERLAIVKAGDDHNGYDSCIRISSNYYAVTAYYYMQILGIQTPFQIEKLRDIS